MPVRVNTETSRELSKINASSNMITQYSGKQSVLVALALGLFTVILPLRVMEQRHRNREPAIEIGLIFEIEYV